MTKGAPDYDVTIGIHVWDPLITDAQQVLSQCGYMLRVDQIPKTMRVEGFWTRKDEVQAWDPWNADMGREDLAYMLTTILGLPWDE